MGWRTVIVTQHAKISYSGRRILVQTDEDTHEIPISDIQVLLISTTRVVITGMAISELSKIHAKVIFSDDSGQPVCETTDYYSGNRSNDLLNKQFNWSTQRKQQLWTKVVSSKVNMQIDVCDIRGLNTMPLRNEVDKLEFDDITNREAVIARNYFDLLFDEKDFTRRDFSPVNAALNYGYSILLSLTDREIVANSYLTQLGIHHHSSENDFNLGSDLMEPFRPIIDLWVCQKKFNDFTPDIKFGLVELLNLEILFNGKREILRNAIAKHVQNCVRFLSEETDNIKVQVELINEVQNNAINGNV